MSLTHFRVRLPMPRSGNQRARQKAWRARFRQQVTKACGHVRMRQGVFYTIVIEYYDKFLNESGGAEALDWDNPVKFLQDCVRRALKFDDAWIFDAHVHKIHITTGHPYCIVRISKLERSPSQHPAR